MERIQEFLDSFEIEDERDQVWCILSALRGPDNEDQRLKKWTYVVREALSTKFFKLGGVRVRYHGIPKRYIDQSLGQYESYLYQSVVSCTFKPLRHFANYIALAVRSIKQDLEVIEAREKAKPTEQQPGTEQK